MKHRAFYPAVRDRPACACRVRHKNRDPQRGGRERCGERCTDRCRARNGAGTDFREHGAASSDAFEIATSKLALETSKSASVKAFAQKMITAHEQSSAKLKTVSASVVPAILPDPTLNAEQEAKIAALRAKTGADFDMAYASEQSAAHQMTFDALRVYSQSGDVPQLKAFAAELILIVTAHLNMAKSLKP